MLDSLRPFVIPALSAKGQKLAFMSPPGRRHGRGAGRHKSGGTMHGRRVKRAGMGGARHRNSDHKDRHRISVRTDSRRSSCGCGANLRKLGLNGAFSKSAVADVQRLKFFVRRCAPRAVVFLYSKRGSRCMAENFYQLALRTPGIWPLYASSRKQIRQMP